MQYIAEYHNIIYRNILQCCTIGLSTQSKYASTILKYRIVGNFWKGKFSEIELKTGFRKLIFGISEYRNFLCSLYQHVTYVRMLRAHNLIHTIKLLQFHGNTMQSAHVIPVFCT